ncbi:hypothetical protein CSW58_03250 [Caulobacter sp. B11]|nr:hypothetical protein CSW58_03250 [Caulobacter sp. B11]
MDPASADQLARPPRDPRLEPRALVTLVAAVGRGPGMFVICLTAIAFGSLAALRMLSGAARR